MATIKDVARHAGVSTATVSRVLNNSGYFDEKIARRVRQAVEETGYRPNLNWRRIIRKSSETVSFLCGDRDTLHSNLVRMLVQCERLLNDAGYDLVFQSFRYRGDQLLQELRLPHLIGQKGGVDGAILMGKHYGNLLQALDRLPLAYVGLGNNIDCTRAQQAHDVVFYDDGAAAREVVHYLASLGHRRIAFAATCAPWYRHRHEAYRKEMRKLELEEIVVCEPWTGGNVDFGMYVAGQFLAMPNPPTAIFAATDEIAAGIWSEFTARGIVMPRDMSLIGFEDRPEFHVLQPGLSSVSIFPERLAAELVQMLLEKLKKPGLRIESRTLPCQVVRRASCGPPPARGQ